MNNDLEQLIFDDANVRVLRDECTSDVGDGTVTEKVARVECDSWAIATVFIEAEERSEPHFAPVITVRREVDGEPVTLRGFLQDVKAVQDEPNCAEGNFKVCYVVEVELG